MKTVTTAKGHTFDCGFFAEATVGVLYMILINTSLATVAVTLADSEELETLTFTVTDGEEETVREVKSGYVVLVSINQMADGGIRVGLRRPYVGEEI